MTHGCVMSHECMRHVKKKKITHGCVMSHECMRHVSYIFTSAVSLLDISRVYMDDSCRTNGWVTSHVHTQRPRWTWSIHMSHVTCIHWWAMSHQWMSHVTCTYAATTVKSELTHKLWHMCVCISHVAYMDESCYIDGRVMLHKWMSRINGWVVLHKWMSHVA